MWCRKLLVRGTIDAFRCTALLFSVTAFTAAVAPLFDSDRAVVLPSAFGKDLWERHRVGSGWLADDWTITADDLKRTDIALAGEFSRARIGRGLPGQYMPGRWHGDRVIFINGFGQTDAEMFSGRGTPTDRWKHEPVIAFGGGCWFWYAAYLADQNRFVVLNRQGGHDQRIVCNRPK